ncbi:MraY family glycosyltransferase [Bordetella genomosp. 11]|uniref:Glycosyl transferase n=1 Tax=Bordetella genomosp. 11 TaxID=1416808 RepID=A0A261UN69_9BORD|nr:glycosyltransferase [Bordetella genomosp. 11]OZI62987.1 glycosyl transferase [Bordetella genomosp. 11]
MLYVSIAFIASAICTLLTLRFGHWHLRYTGDTDMTGVQKYHVRPVPRVGGMALVVGMLVVAGAAAWREPNLVKPLLLLMLCGMPAFLGGLAEDVTKRVRAVVRLLLAMLAGGLAYYFLGAAVLRLNIIGVDWLLQFWVISLICTMIAVGGASNAINIIDGYNGLAAVVSVMILAGMAYVSYYLGDRLLVVASVGMMGAIGGFLIWNYPRGLIFLGDGGAYFIGYMIGELSVLMLYRHPNVSAWFPLLLCIYPVFETLFSIYRKRWLRGRSPGMPDGVHLHMLVYKRLVRWAIGSTEVRHKIQRNAMTSPYLWVLSSLAVIPAVLFWQYQYVLMGFVALFSVVYLTLYRTLVRFATPRWLMVKKEADDV